MAALAIAIRTFLSGWMVCLHPELARLRPAQAEEIVFQVWGRRQKARQNCVMAGFRENDKHCLVIADQAPASAG